LNLTIAEDVTLTVPRGSEKNLKANILVNDLIKAPVTAGQELGQLHVSLDGEALVDIPLVAEKSIPKAGIFSQLFDWIILLFTRLLS
jgi:D-alanyl-D-alanine carboxypeptidase (penicillin-binding protein 5/6)